MYGTLCKLLDASRRRKSKLTHTILLMWIKFMPKENGRRTAPGEVPGPVHDMGTDPLGRLANIVGSPLRPGCRDTQNIGIVLLWKQPLKALRAKWDAAPSDVASVGTSREPGALFCPTSGCRLITHCDYRTPLSAEHDPTNEQKARADRT